MASCARYVKFLRGTPQAFAALPHKEEDTLYFICEKDEEVGQLWIGNRLITQSTDDDSVLNYLNELKDVDTSGARQDQYLGYDASQQKWIPMTPEQVIQVSVMMGATDTYAGQSGLVPAPAAGDNKKFLRGDGKWIQVETVTPLDLQILQAEINNKATKEDVITVSTNVQNIARQLNEFVSITSYNNKMESIDKEIASIKDSTIWHSL